MRAALAALALAACCWGCGSIEERRPETTYYGVEWLHHGIKPNLRARTHYRFPLLVRNSGTGAWSDLGDVLVGTHFLSADGRRLVHFGRYQTGLPATALPGETLSMWVVVYTPDEPGEYELQLDMLHDKVTWFSASGEEVLRIPVTVGPYTEDAPETYQLLR